MEPAGIRVFEYGNRWAEFKIYPIADLHLGNADCAKDRLQIDLDLIRGDSHSYALILGDYFDAILPGDPRFDPEMFDGDFRVKDLSRYAAILTDYMVDLFMPLCRQKKLLGIGYGNHEMKYYTKKDMKFIHKEICKRLKAPDIMYSSIMDLYFVHNPSIRGCRMYKSDTIPIDFTAVLRMAAHHGFSSAGTPGGRINALVKFANLVDCDLALMGHLHDAYTKPIVRISVNNDVSDIKQKQCLAILTGSYLKSYADSHTSWAESRGMLPSVLGSIPAKFRPYDGRLGAETVLWGIGKNRR